MIPARLIKSASFRFMLLYAGLFGVSVLVLCVVVYWRTVSLLHGEINQEILNEITALDEVRIQGGLVGLGAELGERAAQTSAPPSGFYYLLQSLDGRKLAGNLVPPFPTTSGWAELPPVFQGEDAEDHVIFVRTVALPEGAWLSVGQDAYTLRETQERLLQSFGVAGLVTMVLAVVGGLVMSAGLLRRLDNVNRTCREIIEGDLSRRVSIRATGDEFDQFALTLNTMLDRIETLMEGLHQVSNDIAHDLRTPLARLRQGLEAAYCGARTDEDYDAAIRRAISEADTILLTFGSLLRIARVESGAGIGPFSEVNVSDLAVSLLETYGPVAEDRDQRLVAQIAEGVRIHADRSLLTQMIVNLIENALKHGPRGTQVALGLQRIAGGVELTVQDNGPGIPADERQRVFRRFYRLDRSRTTAGSGLGLSLVAAIASLHGASIRLHDAQPGLCVTLCFPTQGASPVRSGGADPNEAVPNSAIGAQRALTL